MPKRRPARVVFASLAAFAALLIGATATRFGATGSAPAPSSSLSRYVVHAKSEGILRSDVRIVGGSVDSAIPSLGDAVVSLNTSGAARLGAMPGVLVGLDGAVQVTDTAPSPAGPPDAVFPEVTGASQLVAAGDTGQHVTVAVLDTGIDASLPDLSGRVIDGVDLTGGGHPFTDQYGHGTFVAGLIGSSGASSQGHYVGEAPGVDLVSIKVAGANGETSVGTIVSGIAWAISHKATDNIRVLNLSLGAVPTSASLLDPLDQAAEQAWRAGIVVVTTAGNAGPSNGTITSPGNDPVVITVGALDDDGTDNPSLYSVPSFSGVGPTRYDGWIKPDVVAPGESVVSLADPGSTIDNTYPSARVGASNFLGSGTSFSAAIVSGEVALMVSADPSLTPDQVKSRLLLTTDPGPDGNPFIDGHGITNVDAAVTTAGVPTINQNAAVVGEALSAILHPVSSLLFGLLNPIVSLLTSWSDGTWNPGNWSGNPPAGLGWNIGTLPVLTPLVTGAAWNGAAWNGAAWNGAAWNEATWTGAAWNGAAWNGAAWNGAAWNDFVRQPH